ncbi:hypothetical protein Vadar_009158 [Vaccinium darrowii]|uniref:Uncharacterized protein n=1 Tax=Vaccinium darrowii TaxID=229202 RepID=A0ACB7Z9Y0_9ERIC|nr:hypothetical protein Vadar_009158 [Vaccinium darrowii]
MAILTLLWIPPLAVGVKLLNTDGCVYATNNKVGFGGLFGDHRGQWLLRYYGKLSCKSSLEAEIWAIYCGLTITSEKVMPISQSNPT